MDEHASAAVTIIHAHADGQRCTMCRDDDTVCPLLRDALYHTRGIRGYARPVPTRRPRLALVLTVIGLLVLGGSAVATALLLRPEPAPLAVVPAAQAPSATTDGAGIQACRELEELLAAPTHIDTHLSSLGTVAVVAIQATDEDVREAGEHLREQLKPREGDDALAAHLRADLATSDVVRACDAANYAF